MNMGYFIGNTILSSLVGSFFGFLVTIYKNSWKNKRKYRYHQLDRLYGPIYALILQYKHHRKTIDNVVNKTMKGKDFAGFNGNQSDDELVAKTCTEKCLTCSERIFELLTSNIMYARKEDITTMEAFVKKYCDYNTAYISSESSPVISNYAESAEISDNFINVIQNGYKELMSKII
ncbi:MAG: hypothetical protein K2X50_03345 [Gammaproteobacteria bacterium]|nr:hypothetical protein [Gammaproteobacteria bacterium]